MEPIISRIYQDNTVCYFINNKSVDIRNKGQYLVADWFLRYNYMWFYKPYVEGYSNFSRTKMDRELKKHFNKKIKFGFTGYGTN